MKKAINFIFAISFFSIFGCSLSCEPTEEQINQADFGKFPSNYERIVKNHLNKIIIDSKSAKFSEWAGPSKAYHFNYGDFLYGYKVCVLLNSKTPSGDYGKSQPYYYLIKNEEIQHFDGGYDYGSPKHQELIRTCGFL